MTKCNRNSAARNLREIGESSKRYLNYHRSFFHSLRIIVTPLRSDQRAFILPRACVLDRVEGFTKNFLSWVPDQSMSPLRKKLITFVTSMTYYLFGTNRKKAQDILVKICEKQRGTDKELIKSLIPRFKFVLDKSRKLDSERQVEEQDDVNDERPTKGDKGSEEVLLEAQETGLIYFFTSNPISNCLIQNREQFIRCTCCNPNIFFADVWTSEVWKAILNRFSAPIANVKTRQRIITLIKTLLEHFYSDETQTSIDLVLEFKAHSRLQPQFRISYKV